MRDIVKALTSAVACAITGIACADSQTVSGITWQYRTSNNEAELYCQTTGEKHTPTIPMSTSGSVTIPSSLGGCSVTRIGEWAFWECSNITGVTIPNTVTCIDDYAFAECTSLRNLTIPNTVTYIGEEAFFACHGLKTVSIPASVTQIKDLAFMNCSGITSFSVNSANPNFSTVNCMLSSKDRKTIIQGVNGSVVIPDGVTSIDVGAFKGFSGLTSVVIPDSVTSIGGTYRGDWGCAIFQNCSSLTSVTLSKNVIQVGNEMFDGCSSLKSIEIPRGVNTIGGAAFQGCSSMTSITIPSTVQSIGLSAFSRCSRLETIYVSYTESDTNSMRTIENIINDIKGLLHDYAMMQSGQVEAIKYIPVLLEDDPSEGNPPIGDPPDDWDYPRYMWGQPQEVVDNYEQWFFDYIFWDYDDADLADPQNKYKDAFLFGCLPEEVEDYKADFKIVRMSYNEKTGKWDCMVKGAYEEGDVYGNGVVHFVSADKDVPGHDPNAHFIKAIIDFK